MVSTEYFFGMSVSTIQNKYESNSETLVSVTVVSSTKQSLVVTSWRWSVEHSSKKFSSVNVSKLTSTKNLIGEEEGSVVVDKMLRDRRSLINSSSSSLAYHFVRSGSLSMTMTNGF